MKYYIEGEAMPVVICELENNETIKCESGAMSWMSPNMKMETVGGGLGKMLGRAFSGEHMFQNHYTAQNGQGMIAFASKFVGTIMPLTITPNTTMICQKSAYLASEMGVELALHFRKKIGAGLFGGEGFIMQRLSGNGLAFIELDGYVKEYFLQPGQQIIVNTTNVAALEATCNMDVQTVGGVKNTIFGGEGLFNTVITGPGRVILQSMPISNLVGMIASRVPRS